jgi:hypothetical protein
MNDKPDKEDFEAVLRFLPLFETGGYGFGEWAGGGEIKPGVLTFPYVVYSPESMEFLEALYGHGWIMQDFDWGAWQDEAGKYWSAPELIREADLETLRKLLTLHVRKDRFCEGHLLAAFQNGQITAILRRMKELAG